MDVSIVSFRSLIPALLVLVACGGGDGTPSDTGQLDPGTSLDAVQDTTPDVLGDPGVDTGPDLGPYPKVSIQEPARGTYATNCGDPYELIIDVQSEALLTSVTLQGLGLAPVTGEHKLKVQPDYGLNLFRAEALTEAGALGREHRSMLCGQYLAPEDILLHAADVYLGDKALNVVGQASAAWFDSLDLTKMFIEQNPIYESLLVNVNAVSVTRKPGTEVVFTPAWDKVLTHFVIHDLDVTVSVELVGSPSKFYDVSVKADAVAADGDLTLKLSTQSKTGVTLSELLFEFTNLQLEIAGVADDLLVMFPEMEQTLVDTITVWLADTLTDYVPQAAADALSQMDDPAVFEMFGKKFQVRFIPDDLDVTPDGLHFAMDLALSGLKPLPSIQSPGVLHTPGQEQWPDVEGVRLSIKDDFLNALFHEVWRAGLLHMTIDQAFLNQHKIGVTLTAGFLGEVLDHLPVQVAEQSPITAKLATTFPTVADLTQPASGDVRLGLGDLIMEIYAPKESPGNPVLTLAATLILDAALAAGTGAAVEIQPGSFDLSLDVVDDDGSYPAIEDQLETTTAGILEALMPLIGNLFGSMPVPSFGDFAVTDISVGTDASDGGVVVVTGDLIHKPAR